MSRSSTTRVVAVRHGETDWNREGRLQGWAPVPLNDRGREQADAVAGHVAAEYDVDRVFVSDLRRTRQTAERLLARLDDPDPPVSYEAAWRERDLGVYQGLTYEDAEAHNPRFGLGEAAYEAVESVPESGESLRDLADRVTRRLHEVVDEHAGETLLVVLHGGPLRVLLGEAKGLALPAAMKRHHPENCAITEFEFEGGDVAIHCENDTGWR